MNDKERSHPLSDHPQNPAPCPDPLCLTDLDPYSLDCIKCQDEQSTRPRKPGWGGKRPGAGAPRGNLNALKHGEQSKLLKTAIDIMMEFPELRAFLILIARAAVTGKIPETTRKLITQALATPQREGAIARLRRLRDES